MSEQDKRLDDVFKAKVNSAQVGFREDDWLKAKQLIAADRRNNKRRFFVLFFVLFSLAGIATTVYLSPLKTSGHAPLQTTFIAPDTTPQNNEAVVSDKNTDPGSGAESGGAYAGTSANRSTDNARNNPGSTTKKQHGEPSKTRSDVPVSRKAALLKKQQSTATIQGKNNNRKNTIPSKEDEVYLITSGQSDSVSVNHVPDPVYITTKANSPFFTLTALCDTCNRTIKNFLAYKSKQTRKNGMTLEAGMNYYNKGSEWYTPLDIHCGIMFHQYLSSAIRLNAGIGYTRIRQDLPARNFSGTDYTFGAMPTTISIETQRLDYLDIPLSFGLYFLTDHSITAGVSYLYLLQSSDLITTSVPGGSKKEKQDNGYVSVFNTRDWQAHISYSYQITRSFSASLGYYTGLTDITNDEKYKIRQNDRNKGVRLSIGYKLW